MSGRSKKINNARLGLFSLRSCTFSKCVTVFGFLFLVLAVVLTFLIVSNPYPAHASCAITWSFQNSCLPIQNAIRTQIEKWKGSQNCQIGGQRCLYELVSESIGFLKATHMTPVKHYIDDLNFNFSISEEETSCTVMGFSSSQLWYAILDYGTNYCNLHNLITGAGLNTLDGFIEKTQDLQCTQYSQANCDKY